MRLPTGFQFSQGSLQDYVDCPRRFQLRYVHRLRWPAVETEPALENERHLRQGAAFHRLIHQHLSGIPADKLSEAVSQPGLRLWWHGYLESGLAALPPRRYPELRLSTPLSDYRLVAQYDLIAVAGDEQVLIVDWKTNRKRPARMQLAERLQTRVYPYVLVRAKDALEDGMVVHPARVKMIYWFANFPAQPERFRYDTRQYRADEQYLLDLIEMVEREINACADGGLLPRVGERRRCDFCRYRSLCQRGVEPGWFEEAEHGMGSDEVFDVSLDFEQIAELEAG